MTIFKQLPELADRTKTQTRRVVKPGEEEIVRPTPKDHIQFHHGQMYISYPAHEWREIMAVCANGRVKYRVGNNYAIVPKRGMASVGRYELLGIRRQPLQAISEADARAEGLWCNDAGLYTTSVLRGQAFPTAQAAYQVLWSMINTRAPYRWQDNPDVWVYTIKVLHLDLEAVR